MLPEILLIKYILIYNNYIKYRQYININKEHYKELYIIYNIIDKWFTSSSKDLSVAEFAVFFFSQYPRLKPEERDAYAGIFSQADTATLSTESVALECLETIKKRSRAIEIAQKAIAYSEGRSSDEDLALCWENWSETGDEILEVTTNFVTDDLEQLKNETVSTPGLRWRLASLNRSLGSLRRGDFGFVFARPETGKTTFLASEVTYFAQQSDKPVLWFNNEEQGNKVKIRCFQAALGVTLVELFGNTKRYQSQYRDLVGERIKIYDSGVIFKSEVERVIAETSPGLIIFDQIDKIRGFSADRNDLVMGAIYQWARGLAKEFAPVIGICQADGTGEGMRWLTMSHVAEAKTAKQAEADWILGIGKTNEDMLRNVRHFHISKNKLMGDEDSEEEMRHGKWDVLFQPEIARYKDVG